MTVVSAIILFGVLIFVHEFGHFSLAKLLGVKVLKFSLGFGPKLIGKKYGDTEYMISAIPLGGYVKMLGEDTEEKLSVEEEKTAFNHQRPWKRALIVLAGPVCNVLFAAFIFWVLYMTGIPALLATVGDVTKDSPAMKAGLMKGDAIVSINGNPVRYWDDASEIIHKSPDIRLAMKIQRAGRLFDIDITPEKKTVKDIFGEKREIGIIGITPSGEIVKLREGPVRSLNKAVLKTWEFSELTIISVVKLIERVIPASTLGGPILILEMAGKQAAQGALSFFIFMAVISINLGVLNILPIPILDGGHILFITIEVLRRKPLSQNTMEWAQKIGLILILGIIALATYNDIFRLISGSRVP